MKIIIMTKSNDQERGSIRKELGKLEDERKEVIPAPQIEEEEEPSMIEYNSEDKLPLSKIKISPTKVMSREEKVQESYKTPEQVSDEDYKVAPTSADEERVRSEKQE
jgi:hypothetical protein